MSIPVIDISPLLQSFSTPEALRVSQEIYDACCSWGFFQIVGHNIPMDLQADLLRCTKDFFELPEKERLEMHVRKGGVAWRGYMYSSGS
jgi:isopenicillin N synthase-like dioxygenase